MGVASSFSQTMGRSLVLTLGAAVAATCIGTTPAAAQSEMVEYYATDDLGSIRAVFNAAGEVVARSEYLPFGEALHTTGSLPAQRFTGQERDGEAGLDNFNLRTYQPRTARLGSTDPIFAGPYDPQSWNRYAYALNNPLSFTDPSGADPEGPHRPSDEVVIVIGRYPRGPYGGGPYQGDERPPKPPPTKCQQRGERDTCSGRVPPPNRDPGNGGSTGTTDPDTTEPPKVPKPKPMPEAEPEVCDTVGRLVVGLSGYIDEARIAAAQLGRVAGQEWWINQVRPSGRWDLKRGARSWPERRELALKGNIVYGATGRAVGYTHSQLLAGSVIINAYQYGPGAFFGDRWSAEMRDHSQIGAGIQFYESGCR